LAWTTILGTSFDFFTNRVGLEHWNLRPLTTGVLKALVSRSCGGSKGLGPLDLESIGKATRVSSVISLIIHSSFIKGRHGSGI